MKNKILFLFVIFNLLTLTTNVFAESVSKKSNVSYASIYVQSGKKTTLSFMDRTFNQKNLSYYTTSGNVELKVCGSVFPGEITYSVKENQNKENAFLIVLDRILGDTYLNITPLKKDAEITILVFTASKELYALNIIENETEPFDECINIKYKQDYGD